DSRSAGCRSRACSQPRSPMSRAGPRPAGRRSAGSASSCRLPPRAHSPRAGAAPLRLARRSLYQAPLVLDVIFELAAEVLDEALDRQRGGVTERADRAPGDVVGHVIEQCQIFDPALARLDAVHDAIEPSGAFSARSAL